MIAGYSRRTVADNIAAAMRRGDTRDQAIFLALSSARASWFKRYPKGWLPAALQYPKGRGARSHYDANGQPIAANPVRNLGFTAAEKRRLRQKVDADTAGTGAAVRAAARRYTAFTGHKNVQVTQADRKGRRDLPAVVLKVGYCDGLQLRLANGSTADLTWSGAGRPILAASPDGKKLFLLERKTNRYSRVLQNAKCLAMLYTTIRDHQRERYIHEFETAASRPLLRVSVDGKSLYPIGGSFTFTDRGIVDR